MVMGECLLEVQTKVVEKYVPAVRLLRVCTLRVASFKRNHRGTASLA